VREATSTNEGLQWGKLPPLHVAGDELVVDKGMHLRALAARPHQSLARLQSLMPAFGRGHVLTPLSTSVVCKVGALYCVGSFYGLKGGSK
jgi:hypothetical protein